MSSSDDDPHCPECGEPIGQRATYCMHCSADLSGGDENGEEDLFESSTGETGTEESWASSESTDRATSEDTGSGGDYTGGAVDSTDDELLDPDGLVDNTLTIVVGIISGFIIGFISFITGIIFFAEAGFLFGLLVWLGGTVYLSRQRTVQGALSLGGYGVAAALLSLSLVPLAPAVDAEGGLSGRLSGTVIAFLILLVPAGIAAGIGWFADRFVPEETEDR